MKLKASKAPVWAECPGSQKIEGFSPHTESKIEGIVCHKLTRLLGTGAISMKASLETVRNSGRFSPQDADFLTNEHLEMANMAAMFCLSKGDSKSHWETFTAINCRSSAEISGISDFINYDRNVGALHIVENKFGYTPVFAECNWQLLCYAAGALAVRLPGDPFKINEFHLHVCQPRDYANGSFKTWILSLSNWDNWYAELLNRVEYAARGETLRTGNHCRYCDAKTNCPAISSTAMTLFEMARGDVENLPLTALSKQYSFLLEAKNLINMILNAAESRIFHEIESGTPVPGWQIGRKRGSRKLQASVTELEILEKISGIPLTEKKPLPLGKIPKNAQDALASYIVNSPGAKHLTPFNETEIQQVFKNDSK